MKLFAMHQTGLKKGGGTAACLLTPASLGHLSWGIELFASAKPVLGQGLGSRDWWGDFGF